MQVKEFISKLIPKFIKNYIHKYINNHITSYLNNSLEDRLATENVLDRTYYNDLIDIQWSLLFNYIILNQKNLYNHLHNLDINTISQANIPSLPSSIGLKSKVCTQSDLESQWCRYWIYNLHLPISFNRKNWEYAFVLQALYENNMLNINKYGLGFACGQEIIPSFLASKGCTVVASDKPEDTTGWSKTSEYTSSIDSLYFSEIVDKNIFLDKISLQYIDMNNLNPSLYNKFDFCWSICALEHLGSINHGLEFLTNSVKLLKPGGVSVHTTEFNYLNTPHNLETESCVIFNRDHFLSLKSQLLNNGYLISDFCFDSGVKFYDKYIDLPPFYYNYLHKLNINNPLDFISPRLKIFIAGYPSTCFGIIIKKPDTHIE
jgi:hypothetical protein